MLKKIFHYLQLKPDHINAQDVSQRLSTSASKGLQWTPGGSVLSSSTRHLEAQELAFRIVIWLLNSTMKTYIWIKLLNKYLMFISGLGCHSPCGHIPLPPMSWRNPPLTTHIHVGSLRSSLLIPQEKPTLQEVWLAVDEGYFHLSGPTSLNNVTKIKHHILISKNWTNAPEF